MADHQNELFSLRLFGIPGAYFQEAITPDGRSILKPFDISKIMEHTTFFESFRTSEGIAPTSSEIENVGRILFDAFDGKIRQAFYQAQGEFRNGFQFRLQIEAENLEAIPWEVLNDGEWLATNPKWSFVRSFGNRQFDMRMDATPLRVFVAYAATNWGPESIKNVQEELEAHLKRLENGGHVIVTRKPDATIDDLDITLMPQQDIFMIVGHGKPGGIYLFDQITPGATQFVGPESLSHKINDNPPRLVFFAACQTSAANHDGGLGLAQGLWREMPKPIPALVAMQTYIDGSQAGRLAGKFLEFVAHGKPVDAAMSMAREELIRGPFPPARDVFSAVLYLQSATGDVFSMRDRPLEWFLPGDISLDGGSTWRLLTERMIAAYMNAGFNGKGTVHRPANQYRGTNVALQEFCTSDKHDFVLATGELWSHTDYIGACAAHDEDILTLHAAYGQKDGGKSEPLNIYVTKSTLKKKRHVAAFLDFFFARVNDQIPRFAAGPDITYTAIGSATLEEHRQTIKRFLDEEA